MDLHEIQRRRMVDGIGPRPQPKRQVISDFAAPVRPQRLARPAVSAPRSTTIPIDGMQPAPQHVAGPRPSHVAAPRQTHPAQVPIPTPTQTAPVVDPRLSVQQLAQAHNTTTRDLSRSPYVTGATVAPPTHHVSVSQHGTNHADTSHAQLAEPVVEPKTAKTKHKRTKVKRGRGILKKILVSLTVLLILGGGVGGYGAYLYYGKNVTMTTYNNSQFGYYIDHPSGWEQTEDTEANMVTFKKPGSGVYNPVLSSVLALEVDTTRPTSDQVNEMKDKIINDNSIGDVSSPISSTIGGFTAVTFEGTFNPDDIAARHALVTIYNDDTRIYVLQSVSPKTDWWRNKTVTNKTHQSFRK